MAAPGPIRWGAMGFVLSGAVWFVLGLSALLGYLQVIPGREDVVLFLVAHLLLADGLVGLHALQKHNYGHLGQVGFYVALSAAAARTLGALVFIAGSLALEWISFPGTWACSPDSCSTALLPCKRECCRAGTAWLSSLPCPLL